MDDDDVSCFMNPNGCPWPLACDEPIVCAANWGREASEDE